MPYRRNFAPKPPDKRLFGSAPTFAWSNTTQTGTVQRGKKLRVLDTDPTPRPVPWWVQVFPQAPLDSATGLPASEWDTAAVCQLELQLAGALVSAPPQKIALPMNGFAATFVCRSLKVEAVNTLLQTGGATGFTFDLYALAEPIRPPTMLNQSDVFGHPTSLTSFRLIPPFARRVHLLSDGLGLWRWVLPVGHLAAPLPQFAATNEIRPVDPRCVALEYVKAAAPDEDATVAWEMA